MLVVGGIAGGVDDSAAAIDVAAYRQRAIDDDVAREIDSARLQADRAIVDLHSAGPVSYTHLTLPTIAAECRSRWSPYH